MWDKSLLKVSSYKELTYQNVAEMIIRAVLSDPMLEDDIAILDYIRPSCSEPESIIPSVIKTGNYFQAAYGKGGKLPARISLATPDGM